MRSDLDAAILKYHATHGPARRAHKAKNSGNIDLACAIWKYVEGLTEDEITAQAKSILARQAKMKRKHGDDWPGIEPGTMQAQIVSRAKMLRGDRDQPALDWHLEVFKIWDDTVLEFPIQHRLTFWGLLAEKLEDQGHRVTVDALKRHCLRLGLKAPKT
ncbi:MAG: hypothetical protein ACLFS1_10460 [Opitutales bacterium]